MKERVGSSARNGDGEGGTNDVYASRTFGSRLGRPDGQTGYPFAHLKKISVKLSAQLASEAFQRAQIWLSYNGQVQVLREFKSKHRQVDFIVGEN